MTSHPTPNVTRLFARVLGPYLLVAAAAAAGHSAQINALIAQCGEHVALRWVIGGCLLISGVIVIGLHGHWWDFTAIVVTLLGWVFVANGALLLASPGAYLRVAAGAVNDPWWPNVLAGTAVGGLCLTVAGWATPWRVPPCQGPGLGPDVPRDIAV